MTATRTLVVERELPHPPEKIWRAITQGALLKEWLMDNDFQPVVGHRFTFRAAPNPNWSGVIESQVLVVEPNKTLSYSWGAVGLGTVVVWTLVATGGGTLLRMEQSGFGPDQGRNYGGARIGWQRFLTNLEQLLARTQ
jgi:uncharacterized protein YndB with AHSA1/START domain